jgi:hypothetical protein
MQLPRRDDPTVDVCGLVFDWLNHTSTGHWLLVLDNADDSSIFLPCTGSGLSSGDAAKTRKPLLNYIPRKLSSKQSILITTRDSRLGENLTCGVPPIDVPRFEPAESKMLLASKAGKQVDSLDDSDAEELLEILDHIPLAISQAAAFMRQNNRTLQEYLKALTKDERNLSEYLSAQHQDPRRELGIPSSVFRTWKLMFDQIRVQNPRAAEMLSLSAMFDRQQIPEHLLLLGQEDKNDLKFVQAIGTLTGFSLITKEIGQQTFSIHRLVQLSILAWLEQNYRKADYELDALLSMAKSCSGDTDQLLFRRALERLYPHAQAVLQYRFQWKEAIRAWAYLLCIIIDFDRVQGRMDVAQEKSLQACRTTCEMLGEDDSMTLASLFRVTRGLTFQGEYKEAEVRYRQMICGYKKTVGADHEFTLASLLQLAKTLRRQEKYGAAEKISIRVLEKCENILGIEHWLTLKTVQELSYVLQDQGKVEAAEALGRRVLDELENKLGADHLQTIAGVENLAVVLEQRGKYQAAEQMYRRALSGRMNHEGEEHPSTLRATHQLAVILERRGDYREAEEMHRQILEREKKVLGGKGETRPTASFSLALNLSKQGKYHSASPFAQRALACSREIFGPDHQYTIGCSKFCDSLLEKMKEEAARG